MAPRNAAGAATREALEIGVELRERLVDVLPVRGYPLLLLAELASRDPEHPLHLGRLRPARRRARVDDRRGIERAAELGFRERQLAGEAEFLDGLRVDPPRLGIGKSGRTDIVAAPVLHDLGG